VKHPAVDVTVSLGNAKPVSKHDRENITNIRVVVKIAK